MYLIHGLNNVRKRKSLITLLRCFHSPLNSPKKTIVLSGFQRCYVTNLQYLFCLRNKCPKEEIEFIYVAGKCAVCKMWVSDEEKRHEVEFICPSRNCCLSVTEMTRAIESNELYAMSFVRIKPLREDRC